MSTPPILTSPAEPYERTIRTSSLRAALVKLNANISYEELIKAVREVDKAMHAEEHKVQVDPKERRRRLLELVHEFKPQ